MAAVNWPLVVLLLCAGVSLFVSADQINITAVIGENQTLPCRAENGSIHLVAWKGTDIKEGYVLLFRNDAVDTENQHPSFKDRVFFQDREMKNGDVSLVLINVTMNDNGTYEAEVVYDGTNSKKKLICSIHLDVAPPPPPPGSFPYWLIALLVIAGVLIIILIGVLLYRRHRRHRLCSNSDQQVEEEEAVPLQDRASAQTEERINEANGTVNEAGEQDQTNISGTTMNGQPPRTEDTNGHSRGGAS